MSDTIKSYGDGPGIVPSPITEDYADDCTEPFWAAALEGRLVCQRCITCGTCHLPPQRMCFSCQQESFEWIDLPGTGTVYSFTIVRHPLGPSFVDAVPYIGGVFELDGTQGSGARLLANMVDVDVDTVRIGDRVQVVFDKVSDTLALPRVRPLAG